MRWPCRLPPVKSSEEPSKMPPAFRLIDNTVMVKQSVQRLPSSSNALNAFGSLSSRKFAALLKTIPARKQAGVRSLSFVSSVPRVPRLSSNHDHFQIDLYLPLSFLCKVISSKLCFVKQKEICSAECQRNFRTRRHVLPSINSASTPVDL